MFSEQHVRRHRDCRSRASEITKTAYNLGVNGTHWIPLLCGLACLFSAPLAFAHGGTSNGQERAACADADLSDYCEFTDHHERLHRGTCRSFNDVLMCVRNQPFTDAASGAASDGASGAASETDGESAAEVSPRASWHIPALSLALCLAVMAMAYVFGRRKKEKRIPA